MELLHHYSNTANPWPYEAILRLAACPLAPRDQVQVSSKLYAKSPRLSQDKVAEAVRRYEQGETVRDIAASLSVHRGTVSRYLHIEGMRMRRRPLTDDQVTAAATWYRDGRSLAAIGAQLRVDNTTVWRALIKAGVPMRDPQGRER